MKLMRSDADDLSDQELLEILLYYSIPMRDTMPAAIGLLESFGSLQGVLDAEPDALMQVEGVGECTASFLKLIPLVARRYSENEPECASFSCTDRVQIIRYLSVQYIGVSKEQMQMLVFNARGGFIRSIMLSGGEDVAHVDVFKRRMAQEAVRSDAASVILSHIHPGGVAAPSSDDLKSTRAARDVLQSLGVRLQDHVIYSAPDEYLFLSDLPAYRKLFF